jgi:DNA-binding beta-propeller fold protein YncE
MKHLCITALGVLLCCLTAARGQEAPQPLRLVQKIVLPGVEGRFDHMSIDLKGKRLFLSGLGNGTVEVIDLAAGKPLHTITGFSMAQAALYVPESNLLFVADGELNVCNIYDGNSYQLISSMPSVENADNLRYSRSNTRYSGTGTVYLGYGEENRSALRVMSARDGTPLSEIPLAGHPESFQIETVPGSFRVFANIPTEGYIAVADTSKRRVMSKWPVPGFSTFFPMALDEKNQRLFIGSRNPPALVVFDTNSGRIVTSVDAGAATDDLFYDAARKRLYMSAGEGAVVVFEQRDADHYQLVAKVPSVPGATTSFFSPDLSRLYVPAPPYGGQPAQVLVYEALP